MSRLRRHDGQATVELVALLPLVLLVGLALMALLQARATSERAAAAAQAGAMALLQGDEDPERAARAALGGREAVVRVEGRRVAVTVEPVARLPFLVDLLEASASADAGPERRL